MIDLDAIVVFVFIHIESPIHRFAATNQHTTPQMTNTGLQPQLVPMRVLLIDRHTTDRRGGGVMHNIYLGTNRVCSPKLAAWTPPLTLPPPSWPSNLLKNRLLFLINSMLYVRVRFGVRQ